MDLFKSLLVLVLLSGTVFFVDLGGAKLWDEDEPRNAGCAVEMLQRGDWVVPHFNGEVRTHKPVLLYWFMMSAYGVFGVGEFAARFWSAALGIGTVLLTWSIGYRLLGRTIGFASAVALATMLMFVVASRAATPDSVLIFFVTASLAVYVWKTPHFDRPPVAANDDHSVGERNSLEPGQSRLYPSRPIDLVSMYALMGIACLAKGPVGFLLPCAIIGMFLLIERLPSRELDESVGARLRYAFSVLHPIHFLKTCAYMRLTWLVTTVLVVALPWYIWVTLRSDGEWTRGFFLEHNIGRAVNAMENHHGGFLYYPVAVLIGTFPWSIFFLPIVIDLASRLKGRYSSAHTFLLCWIAVIIGLFSLASTKLPSYVTPCYPAVAILVGQFLVRLARDEARSASYWPYISMAVLGTVGVSIAVAFPSVGSTYLADSSPLALVGVVLLIGAIAGGVAWHRADGRGLVGSTIVTACLFFVVAFGWGAGKVSGQREIERLATAMRQSSAAPELAVCGPFRSSWVFYLGGPIRPIDQGSPEAVLDYLAESPDHFVVSTEADAQSWLARSSQPIEVVETIPFFLEPGQHLVLLKGSSQAREVASADTSASRR